MYGTPDLLDSVVSNSDLKEDTRKKEGQRKGSRRLVLKGRLSPPIKQQNSILWQPYRAEHAQGIVVVPLLDILVSDKEPWSAPNM